MTSRNLLADNIESVKKDINIVEQNIVKINDAIIGLEQSLCNIDIKEIDTSISNLQNSVLLMQQQLKDNTSDVKRLLLSLVNYIPQYIDKTRIIINSELLSDFLKLIKREEYISSLKLLHGQDLISTLKYLINNYPESNIEVIKILIDWSLLPEAMIFFPYTVKTTSLSSNRVLLLRDDEIKYIISLNDNINLIIKSIISTQNDINEFIILKQSAENSIANINSSLYEYKESLQIQNAILLSKQNTLMELEKQFNIISDLQMIPQQEAMSDSFMSDSNSCELINLIINPEKQLIDTERFDLKQESIDYYQKIIDQKNSKLSSIQNSIDNVITIESLTGQKISQDTLDLIPYSIYLSDIKNNNGIIDKIRLFIKNKFNVDISNDSIKKTGIFGTIVSFLYIANKSGR